LKKPSSPFFSFGALSFLKYLSFTSAGTETPVKSTLVEVPLRYLWLTLLRGTPLSLNGPVTKHNPLSNCFKKTTLLPAYLPAKTIATVPGVKDFFNLVGSPKLFVCFFGLLSKILGTYLSNFG